METGMVKVQSSHAGARCPDASSAQAILAAGGAPGFDRISDHARRLFGVEDALICLHNDPRHATIVGDRVMVIEDAREDPCFGDAPLIAGARAIGFFAGAPITATHGAWLGALCVLDSRPQRFDARDRDRLAELADLAAEVVESRLARDFAQRALDRATDAHRALNAAFMEATETLRETVNGVCGYADLARTALGTPHAHAHAMDALHHSVADLNTVLETAARAAGAHGGGFAVTPQPMRPRDVLFGVNDYLRQKAGRNRVDLRIDAPDAPIEIASDEGLVRYLLLNLIGGVIAGAEENSAVVSQLRPAAQGAEIALIFNGAVGFSAESGLALARQLAAAIEARLSVATHETGGVVSLILPDLSMR